MTELKKYNTFEQNLKKQGELIFSASSPGTKKPAPSQLEQQPTPQSNQRQEGTIFYTGSPKTQTHDAKPSSTTISDMSSPEGSSRKNAEKTPNARRQDEIYDQSGLADGKTFSRQKTIFYVFTNENQTNFMKVLGLNDKKMAGIAASGDFIINAFMKGAKSFDAFDISPVACFMAELKLAAVSELSFEEFRSFFDLDSKQYFSHDLFDRLRPNISKRAEDYVDQLIPNNLPKKILDIDDSKKISEISAYLESKENFEKAKKKTNKALESKAVSFHPLDVRRFLSQNKNKNYDYIYLSNIFSWPPHDPEGSGVNLDETTKTIQMASNALTTGGKILSYTSAAEDDFDKIKKEEREIKDHFNQENTAGMRMKATRIHGDHPNARNMQMHYSLLVLEKIT